MRARGEGGGGRNGRCGEKGERLRVCEDKGGGGEMEGVGRREKD